MGSIVMEWLGSLLSVGRPWTTPAASNTYERDVVLTTVHNPPFVLVKRLSNGTFHYDGYLVRLWELCARQLGLRYRIEPLLSGDYGSVGENGTWSGMVGELAYGRADVAMTALYLRQDRAAVIDYLDSVAVARSFSTFYVRAGRDGNSMPALTAELFGSLLQPLHISVWWAVLASLLVLSIGLRISLRYGRPARDWQVPTERQVRSALVRNIGRVRVRKEAPAPLAPREDQMGIGSCFLFCFTSFVGQGWPELPTGTAARIVATSCWALRTIIYTSYTANLISHMVTHSVQLPIKSLQEFAELPGWKLAIQPGHAILNDWKRSRDPYERDLYRRSVTRQGFIPINFKGDSIFELVQPKVMTFVNFDKIVYALGSEVCQLMPVPGLPVKSTEVYMAISKRKPALRLALNDVMFKIKETGSLDKLRARWIKSQDEMCTTSSEYQQMSLADILVVLVILPVAMAACVVLCLSEWVWYKMSRSAPVGQLVGKMKGKLSDSLLAVMLLRSRLGDVRGELWPALRLRRESAQGTSIMRLR